MLTVYELHDWSSILESGRNFSFSIKSRPKPGDKVSFLGNNSTRAGSSQLTSIIVPKITLFYFPIYLHAVMQLSVYAK
jgi:hypothetical protein